MMCYNVVDYQIVVLQFCQNHQMLDHKEELITLYYFYYL